MTRSAWLSLNGPWDYALTDSSSINAPASYDKKILVPYPYESALSGCGEHGSIPSQRIWYHRTFTIPIDWIGKTILLHFGAVNYESTVSINGGPAYEHTGGYTSFTYDITNQLQPGPNDIVVSANNPLRSDTPDAQVLGKQRLHSGDIFYTSCTGIWQSVWLEPVPKTSIAAVHIVPNVDTSSLSVSVEQSDTTKAELKAIVLDHGRTVASSSGPASAPLTIALPQPHLWTPSDPYLYSMILYLKSGDAVFDRVGTYFAMRKVSVGPDESGVQRILLNNKFVPEIGLLDQGYWPDGIYTAPTDDAMRFDITEAKTLGYNLLRKHAKVEPDRWYYDCDKLGMLVWQDMPQCFGGPNGTLSDASKLQFHTELIDEVKEFWNHPSIVVWTTFNEGWGQHDTESIVHDVKAVDPSRLVDDASGWNDMKVGDISDTHAYPGPWSEKAADQYPRAVVNGEFGGITERVPGHMWTTDIRGYGSMLSNSWQVTKKYQDLLKVAYNLIQTRGTSAFIYTQLTDVEQESNGIMTYDRAVVKPIPAIITAANEGRILPLPPNPMASIDIVPTADIADTPAIWRYTTVTPATGWNEPGFDDSGWKSGSAGFGHGTGVVNSAWTDTPGDIWLRRTVMLPAKLPANLQFRVFHDEDVEIYINGILAASASGYTPDYIAMQMNTAGRAAIKPCVDNLIAVHCRQTVGAQYINVGIEAAH